VTLTDTHCHLNSKDFDADRDEVIERALASGVTRVLIPGLDLESSLDALLMAQAHPNLFAAIGLHPSEADHWDEQTLPSLRELVSPPYDDSDDQGKVVAVGEVGLDYYWDAAPRAQQRAVLQAQLAFAAEIGRPVILHLREKDDHAGGACAADLLGLLEDWVGGLRAVGAPLAERPGVLHAFSGDGQTAERALGLGFYIGVAGPVTYKKADDLRQRLADLPLDRILIETDAPYLTPVPHRGKRNEPSFVRYIADRIGEIHSKHPEEVASRTGQNAARLFDWGD
jgi:TatD DNase family protein